jgi:NitT/TauT family transport system substrate-binding protein
MIDRRIFNVALGAALSAQLTGVAYAQGRRVIKVANPNAVLDASQAFVTCGRDSRLKYYESEGLDIEYVNMSTMTQAMLSIATGQADTGALVPALFLPAVAKEPGLGLVAAYNWLPRNANVVAVKPDSPIRSIKELAGKKIGIRNQGDGGITQLQLMFAELGVPTADIDFVAVGDGGLAGTALSQNKVDALVTFDTAAGRIEAVGFPLRYLPLPPQYGKQPTGWFGFRKKDLKDDRKTVVGFCRGVAKSSLFASTNLAAALQMHWALYPDSKPKSTSDDAIRKEMETILAQRRLNWLRKPGDPDQRMGASSAEEWKLTIANVAKSSNNPQLPQQVGDPANIFTNELIDEINNFDKAAVIRLAKEFKA